MGKKSEAAAAVDATDLMDRLAKHPATELVKIGDVNPAKYNPRTMPALEMRKLESSLLRFGFVEPLVIRRSDMLLIGGHQRLEAFRRILRKKKQEPSVIEVPAILLDGVSDDEAKVLNLALNKIHGTWDFDALASVLRSIDLTGIDIELSGFTLPEIEDIGVLMAGLPSNGSGPDVDPKAAAERKARLFSFEVETEAQAKTCRSALERFGMREPKFASAAFVAICTAALKLPKPSKPLKHKPREFTMSRMWARAKQAHLETRAERKAAAKLSGDARAVKKKKPVA